MSRNLDWMADEWKSVDHLPGYAVSSDGRVLGPKRERKLLLNPDGYPVVSVRRKTYRVHALVCGAFHGPRPTPMHEVRHLNGVRTDNRVENLAWGTPAENAQDTVRHGHNVHAVKTECPKGHPYDEENTYVRSDRRGRNCKECHRESNRKYMRTYVPMKKRAC